MYYKSKNSIIIAVAGSGKTHDICKKATSLNSFQLIVSYTNKGIDSIKHELMKQNNGIIPDKIKIKTWYSFLLSDFIKPYQNFITGKINKIESIDFSNMYGNINYKKRGTKYYYMVNDRFIKANYVSELAIDCNNESKCLPIKRLEEIYSHIYIDEVQDLAGEDLEIIKLLLNSKINMYIVGDHRQKTFSTHNTKKNKKLSGINILNFFKDLEKKQNLEIKCNNLSRRCNGVICDFANKIFDEDIMQSIQYDNVENPGVFLIKKEDVQKYYKKYNPTVLKYDVKTDTMGYPSYNFGQCKGMTFNRTIIFPNGPYLKFLKGEKLKNRPKYYVAATRAKYSIVFVVDEIFENENFVYDNLKLTESINIKVSKFITKNDDFK